MAMVVFMDFFKEFLCAKVDPISIYAMREEYLSVAPMSTLEEQYVQREILWNIGVLSRTSKSIERLIDIEFGAFLRWATHAKAILPQDKEGEFRPSIRPGSLNISWILPKMFRHARDAKTAYLFEGAKIYAVQGERMYLLGSEEEYYHSCDIPGCRSMFVLSMDGFAEMGKVSKISEIRIEIEGRDAGSPLIQNTIGELPVIEWPTAKIDVETAMGVPPELSDLHLYQYKTGGMLAITQTQGVKISVVPTRSSILNPIPLGFAYYESGFLDHIEKIRKDTGKPGEEKSFDSD